jgi:putative SOS response-associated peptidase YedK
MFKDSFKRRRRLMPASGYYEWADTPSGKQPYYFTRRDGQIITIAGLWSKWTDKATGTDLHSCTMVITGPNKFVAKVHDRMPVILEAKDFEQWERGEVKDLSALMAPPNCGGLNSTHIHGTHVPVEEPSTASEANTFGYCRKAARSAISELTSPRQALWSTVSDIRSA